jgi:hypothetical protein
VETQDILPAVSTHKDMLPAVSTQKDILPAFSTHASKTSNAYQYLKQEAGNNVPSPMMEQSKKLIWKVRYFGGACFKYLDLVELVQDRDRWQALVYEVMNLWVP